MENPIKIDDLGVPLFSETSICDTLLKFNNWPREKMMRMEDDPASYWVLKVTFQGLLLLNFRVGIGKRTRNCLGIEQKPRKQKKPIAKFKEPKTLKKSRCF